MGQLPSANDPTKAQHTCMCQLNFPANILKHYILQPKRSCMPCCMFPLCCQQVVGKEWGTQREAHREQLINGPGHSHWPVRDAYKRLCILCATPTSYCMHNPLLVVLVPSSSRSNPHVLTYYVCMRHTLHWQCCCTTTQWQGSEPDYSVQCEEASLYWYIWYHS